MTARVSSDEEALVAVTEHRTSAQIGIAALDGAAPRLLLAQINDTPGHAQTLAMLLALLGGDGSNASVLVSNTNSASPLVAQIRQAFPRATIVTLPRALFNEAAGSLRLRELAGSSSVNDADDGMFLAFAAAAALLEHVASSRGTAFAPGTLLVSTAPAQGHMLIDAASANTLELVVGARTATRKGSLFECVASTRTPAGSRLLLSNILQPLCDRQTLAMRQDAVEEILESEALFFGVGEILKHFQFDLARIATQLSVTAPKPKRPGAKRVAQRQLKLVVELQQALGKLSDIADVLAKGKSSLIHAIREGIVGTGSVLKDLSTKIGDVLVRDAATGPTQLGFAVRPSADPLLDVARRELTESAEDVSRLATKLRSAFGEGFPVTLRHTDRRGYFLEATAEPPKDIGGDEESADDFAIIDVSSIVHRRRGSEGALVWQFSTRSLASASRKNASAWERVLELSAKFIDNLVVEGVRPSTAALVRASDSVALLDMLHSHASFALSCDGPTVRPEFTTDGEHATLAIRAGRHPLLQHQQGHSVSVVPNDTLLEAGGLQLVTGANFSGKSTYVRQVALLAVLAQIGCRVPATFMHMPLFARMHCRSGSGSGATMGAMLAEACDARSALECSTREEAAALIVVDELGRATSPSEGAALAWAVAERFLQCRSPAMTLFVTHFADVAEGLAQCYASSERLSLRMFAVDSAVLGGVMRVRPLFTAANGISSATLGVEAAAAAGLPAEMVAIARAFRETAAPSAQQQQHHNRDERARLLELGKRLCSLRSASADAPIALLRQAAKRFASPDH